MMNFSDSFQNVVIDLQYKNKRTMFNPQKKKLMKKILLTAVVLAVTAITALAATNKDRAITFEQLPAKAQQFINNHFSKKDISFAKSDRELFDVDYEVIFVNGNKIEFNKNGDWKEVDCKRSEVPAKIVPAKIKDIISQHYGNAKVKKISRDLKKGETEVKLSTGIELEFNKYYQLINVDD